jgi:hypothetical protein
MNFRTDDYLSQEMARNRLLHPNTYKRASVLPCPEPLLLEPGQEAPAILRSQVDFRPQWLIIIPEHSITPFDVHVTGIEVSGIRVLGGGMVPISAFRQELERGQRLTLDYPTLSPASLTRVTLLNREKVAVLISVMFEGVISE